LEFGERVRWFGNRRAPEAWLRGNESCRLNHQSSTQETSGAAMREPVHTPQDTSPGVPKGASENPPGARPGHGITQSSKGGAPGPRLPHERDESAHDQQATASTSPEESRHAYEDVKAGRQDTSYSPVTDATYHRQVTPGTTSPPPKRTR
jgi:hypothetical protein